MLASSDVIPAIGDMSEILAGLHYSQSDGPEWSETLKDNIFESKGELAKARECYAAV